MCQWFVNVYTLLMINQSYFIPAILVIYNWNLVLYASENIPVRSTGPILVSSILLYNIHDLLNLEGNFHVYHFLVSLFMFITKKEENDSYTIVLSIYNKYFFLCFWIILFQIRTFYNSIWIFFSKFLFENQKLFLKLVLNFFMFLKVFIYIFIRILNFTFQKLYNTPQH